MAKSNKPIVWGLFAAGGTVSAFVLPALIFVTGLAVPLGIFSGDALSYDRVHPFVSHWFVSLVLFGVITLSLWHAAHRIRITLHDFGLHHDGVLGVILYLAAGLFTIATYFALSAL